jgi:hypothetical protein
MRIPAFQKLHNLFLLMAVFKSETEWHTTFQVDKNKDKMGGTCITNAENKKMARSICKHFKEH